ncbi:MAG: hypothetical protein ACREIA_01600, partial [Opitutaceae bacterium]
AGRSAIRTPEAKSGDKSPHSRTRSAMWSAAIHRRFKSLPRAGRAHPRIAHAIRKHFSWSPPCEIIIELQAERSCSSLFQFPNW